MGSNEIAPDQQEQLLSVLENRFRENLHRHAGHSWGELKGRLQANPSKLWALSEMERTGGEPDVIGFDAATGEYLFCDCAAETPLGRRGGCYDRQGLEARKEHKPASNAMDMAAAMGIELLTEEQYRSLQQLGRFDAKTSSWLQTPAEVRKLGGALFADYRYGRVFVYHNTAQSYYSSRGFRGLLRV
ncbi:hypothetical protein ASU33_04380 [Solirubrum puertoriconensis]|uniref:DUF4256 domain-containing protein n=2 Tax=Solirubrum puertoriconensis TaxID=1751427 RepID=A0A9X0L420_SOLP1|nr:DUF4256 domain-containing protein [Solirubrum puertoriconensis]KUG07101.1 hypothetical protein ASU33_04380 [Solirubrum puertoriconensis]